MNSSYDNFIKLAIKEKPKSTEDFLRIKKIMCGRLKLPIPSNADLREVYEKMVQQRKIRRSAAFEATLKTKSIRTESGVAIVAVLTKPYPCPGKCLYCPSEKNMPKSYLSNEPAVMRAISAKFNPYAQIQNRLRALKLNGHKTDKIELIIMGGTFSYLPKNYQKWFITECFRACNDYPNIRRRNVKRITWKFLIKEQKRNEKIKHRVIGLTLETRPDYIDEKEIINFRNLGCTRVELGVQSIFDDVLKNNRRGHDIEQTIRATELLKNSGFKINYHLMPGLLGSTPKSDYRMFERIFSDSRFQPDMMKIYPTVVMKDSELYNIWKNKKYKPLDNKSFEKLVLKIKKEIIPPYVRISRLVRDVPTISIMAGPSISNFRQIIAKKSDCRCIRCREVRGNYDPGEKIILNRINYDASGGCEIFLEYVSPDNKKLFALLRLRVPFPRSHYYSIANGSKIKAEEKNILPVLQNAAIIRELHTYGKMTGINKHDKKSPQHGGLGKKLMAVAEKIAKSEYGLKKIVVISGIGVRDYYRKLGYRLQDTYMVKSI